MDLELKETLLRLELLEHAAQNDCEPAEKLLQRYKQYRAKSTVHMEVIK